MNGNDSGRVRVAVAQPDAEPLDVDGNARRGADAIREAAAAGARVVVLPELLSTAYVKDRAAVHAAAEQVTEGVRANVIVQANLNQVRGSLIRPREDRRTDLYGALLGYEDPAIPALFPLSPGEQKDR